MLGLLSLVSPAAYYFGSSLLNGSATPEGEAMPASSAISYDTILFIAGGMIMAFVGLAVLIGVIEAWRHRRNERRIRRHLRN